jgi:hypothetical protein
MPEELANDAEVGLTVDIDGHLRSKCHHQSQDQSRWIDSSRIYIQADEKSELTYSRDDRKCVATAQQWRSLHPFGRLP